MPKFEPEINYLEADEVESIIKAAKSLRDKAMFAVAYNCGLRRGEIRLLIRDDYNVTRGMLTVKRLKKRETYWHEIPLWTSTRRLLNAYLKTRPDHHDALFLSRKGCDALGPLGVYYAFLAAAENAGVRIKEQSDGRGNRHPSPHRLRHSIAVHQMNCGIPLPDIQEHLAHTSINTTMVYARVLNPRKRQNAIKMEMSHHFAKF
jgi:integrase/recombinase XerD